MQMAHLAGGMYVHTVWFGAAAPTLVGEFGF